MTNIIQVEENPLAEIPTEELFDAIEEELREIETRMARVTAWRKELARRGRKGLEERIGNDQRQPSPAR
jgi:hypothetical protein